MESSSAPSSTSESASSDPDPSPSRAPVPLHRRIQRAIAGAPRSLEDKGLHHKITLVALLAWVGLGADGLSSSAYGPDEAFRTVGAHVYLAVPLAILTAVTVFIISAGYSRIIEDFPHGGGGYVVATKLLGEKAGVVSGCALLVDYVLTVTVSIAAAGDALFSLPFIPPEWQAWKLSLEAFFIVALLILNIRGVRESIIALTPIFILFVLTHAAVIIGGIVWHVPELPATAASATEGFRNGTSILGTAGMLMLLLHAFSLGGGTYTGIEAVSNGIPMMRHPQVETAKRTMIYMAVSLAFTASGLLVCYLLWHVTPVEGKTMNAVLVERMAGGLPLGGAFIVLFLLAEGAILVVAAQAGFADGPRVLSNMALDSWVPRRFAALSERLTTQNGVVLMGLAALAALLYTRGNVQHLVVMYSINVFLTFSLSLLGMTLYTIRRRGRVLGGGRRPWIARLTLFITGFTVCATILVITSIEKFTDGGWITLLVTGVLVGVCFMIRGHYRSVARSLESAFEGLEMIPENQAAPQGEPDRSKPVAVILTGGYSGFGVHTTLNVFRSFPGHYKGLVFASVGVVDAGGFKGEDSIDRLREQTAANLARYADVARRLGMPVATRYGVGTDTIDEAERLCLDIAKEYLRATFFSGQVVFERETWFNRLLHNQTAFAIQRRLQWHGRNMVILAARAR